MSFISSPRRSFSYQNVDTSSKVEGAGPHELIQILFDELLLSLDQAIRYQERGDTAQMIQARARASTIVNALQDSLDFEKGGELAAALVKIYREASRRINGDLGPELKDKMVSARQMLAEIAEAWKAIAPA